MTSRLVHDTSAIDELREVYCQRYFERRYQGWCNNYDKQYDPFSEWWMLAGGETFCRVTHANSDRTIPGLSTIENYLAKEARFCEINNFIYSDKGSGIALIKDVIARKRREGFEAIYCLVDTHSKYRQAFNLNTSEFGFKSTGLHSIFPDILYRISQRSVVWELLKLKLDNEQSAAELYSQLEAEGEIKRG
ncbi:hypothetical protein GCM10009092_13690 [Bowmanella denitrificans]|uniref:N-acetyltransferase domain-containing protein n=1 Tax=Bowmanella denitrificans TaxID=366582 RepID=A0ABN0WYJ7_9ALTE